MICYQDEVLKVKSTGKSLEDLEAEIKELEMEQYGHTMEYDRSDASEKKTL